MKDNRPALIWLKDIYENDYTCRCGHVCFEHGDVADDMLFDTGKDMLVCPGCGLYVARVCTVDEAYRVGAIKGAEA